MARLFRSLTALLFILTVFANAGGHSSAMAQSLAEPTAAGQHIQAAVLTKRCPFAGTSQLPRGAVSCVLDLIVTGASSQGRSSAVGQKLRFGACADRPLSPWNAACPHGPPKNVS